MGKIINNRYELGDVVYLKTDKDQLPRIVYCFKVFPNEILYECACGTTTSSHYEFELSKEQNVILSTTN